VKVFAYEFITGGGLLHTTLPQSLAIEGEMMINALVDDLARIPGIDAMVSRDPRLAFDKTGIECVSPHDGEDPFVAFARGVSLCDAVWPIAPETGGVLEELSRIVIEEGRLLLGSHPDAVAIAASKSRTIEVLERAGVPCVPVFTDPSRVIPIPGSWVIKPDDGAGCADASVVSSWQDARGWLDARLGEGFVAQPWCDGASVSLSMLCIDGKSTLLSCNQQHVRRRDSRLELEGITVNAFEDALGTFANLAQRIAAVMPRLFGYVGVDLVAAEAGPLVLEINPRLTTSYCGLREALGLNPAELIISATRNGGWLSTTLPERAGAPRAIRVELLSRHAH
jgi:predicted ATP-grasp superfamily ATP-dependent carboligase